MNCLLVRWLISVWLTFEHYQRHSPSPTLKTWTLRIRQRFGPGTMSEQHESTAPTPISTEVKCQDDVDYDVIICGAGPTGLMLALCLQQWNMTYFLADKQLEPDYEPDNGGCGEHAIGLHAGFLEKLAVLDPVRSAALNRIGRKSSISAFGSNLRMEAALRSETPFPYVLVLEQNKFCQLLENDFVSTPVKVHRGYELTFFEVKPQQLSVSMERVVTASFRVGDGIANGLASRTELPVGSSDDVALTSATSSATHPPMRHVRSRYLVGCDGAASIVRRQLGISLTPLGRELNFIMVDCTVTVGDHLIKDDVYVNGSSQGLVIYTRLSDPSVCRVRFSLYDYYGQDRPSHSDKPLTLEEIEHCLNRIFPYDANTQTRFKLSDATWMTTLTSRFMDADRYMDGTASVFLAGDSARSDVPFGSRGLNLGLYDAHNLAYKLALARRGLAGLETLKSYEQERKSHTREAFRRAQSWAFWLRRSVHGFRSAMVLSLCRVPILARIVLRDITMLEFAYPPCPSLARELAVYSSNPLQGARVPDLHFQNHNRLSTCAFHDLLDYRRFTILIICDSAAQVALTAAKLERVPFAFGVFVLPGQQPSTSWSLFNSQRRTSKFEEFGCNGPVVYDSFNEVRKFVRANQGILCVRPDGSVAFCTQSLDWDIVGTLLARQINFDGHPQCLTNPRRAFEISNRHALLGLGTFAAGVLFGVRRYFPDAWDWLSDGIKFGFF